MLPVSSCDCSWTIFFFTSSEEKKKAVPETWRHGFFWGGVCGVSTLMKYLEGNIHTGQLAWLLREMFNWVQTYTYCFLLLLNEFLLIFYKHFVSTTMFLGLGCFVVDQKSRSGFKLQVGTVLLLFRCDIHTQNLLKVSIHKGRNWNWNIESFQCLTIGDQ